MARDAEQELEARTLEIRKLFASYPNAKLDSPELTLESYLQHTAFLPLDQLRRAIAAAIRQSPRFVPPVGELLDAYVNDGLDEIAAVPLGSPLTLENLKADRRFRRRKYLRELRERHTEKLLSGGAAAPAQLSSGK